jgi:arylsulfatase
MNRIVNSRNIGALSSALLLGGTVTAQYSPTPKFEGKIGKTTETTREAYPKNRPEAPAGAPNVVWILIDDIGYGATTAFGGLIETPNFDRLANQGLRYTNWHTCAVSAPTRAALMTGCNAHTVHIGTFADQSYGTPGYDGYLPFERATIAEILRENGYNTFAVGKYHLTSSSDVTAAGPFNRWPTGRGFDHYYGYIPSSGAGDQWNPIIYRDTQREPKDPQGRHFTELITNEAIRYISEQKKADPEKPFFLYYAPGAAHSPHQAAREWINKYRGKFDKGWDWYREETLSRQKKLGVVPANTELPPRNHDVKPWESLTEDEKKISLSHIETFAGFVSHTDHEIGRIVTLLEEIGQLDNTLIVLMIGDNGAASETPIGNFLTKKQNETQEQFFARQLDSLHLIGSAQSKPNFPIGWAGATNTPFRFHKAVSNWEGGTHDPLIVFYPKRIKEKGAIRTQYTYVNDILPTTVELTGVKVPAVINGYKQEPAEGISLAYSIDNPNAPERHTLQYLEWNSSYAIYKDGWKASFPNGIANRAENREKPDAVYLFNIREDFNELHDLADKYPDKVKELAGLFEAEAWKHNVYPLKRNWVNENPLILKYSKEFNAQQKQWQKLKQE